MPTVADRSGQGHTTEYSLVTYNREVAGSPNGVTTPLFSGEIIHDTTNEQLWQAQTLLNNSWVPALRLV